MGRGRVGIGSSLTSGSVDALIPCLDHCRAATAYGRQQGESLGHLLPIPIPAVELLISGCLPQLRPQLGWVALPLRSVLVTCPGASVLTVEQTAAVGPGSCCPFLHAVPTFENSLLVECSSDGPVVCCLSPAGTCLTHTIQPAHRQGPGVCSHPRR